MIPKSLLVGERRIFGGSTAVIIRYMKRGRLIVALIVICVVAVGAIGIWQYRSLRVAHSSFDDYYAFRGCTKLLTRTDTDGTCVTRSGKTIKIVEYQGRWFLDGDLPCKTGLCW